ncbi:MAG: hypothetical protein BWY80_00090 [Firmicutes bacterium ADurb.Bin456]|nr:MAG: hypothetical protein BWY80_00090 [Firmicutes bacterium ADurb.Bin456]
MGCGRVLFDLAANQAGPGVAMRDSRVFWREPGAGVRGHTPRQIVGAPDRLDSGAGSRALEGARSLTIRNLTQAWPGKGSRCKNAGSDLAVTRDGPGHKWIESLRTRTWKYNIPWYQQ